MAGFALGPVAASRGYRVSAFPEIGSTSSAASAAAAGGETGDAWFVTARQTAGRGRRGRVWETPTGNLAASLLIYPECDPALAATLGFVAGVALHRALAVCLPPTLVREAGQGARRITLKWPNDVLADGMKLAGILLEAGKGRDGRQSVVVGMGVNVVGAPAGLPYPATSLNALGADLSAEALFAVLSDEWVVAYELWDHGSNVGDVLRLWRDAAAGLGAEIAVNHDGGVLRGTFENIDEQGRLLVRGNDNAIVAITAGDVHFGATASMRA